MNPSEPVSGRELSRREFLKRAAAYVAAAGTVGTVLGATGGYIAGQLKRTEARSGPEACLQTYRSGQTFVDGNLEMDLSNWRFRVRPQLGIKGEIGGGLVHRY